VHHLQEVLLSRISQPISNYLANAKFSYSEIDANIENIANETKEKTVSVFEDLGFQVIDFRIEGSSFDDETNRRIAGISDVSAEVQAAKLAGIDYVEMQKLKALKDAAKNEGSAGMGLGMLTGINLSNQMNNQSPMPQQPVADKEEPMIKLKKLKEMFDMELITREEYASKKQDILNKL
jgi:membrane protease subunit (stomatin/prohibitin family)